MSRAGLILIKEDKVALIERHRGEQHYFILPGGQIEENENPMEAVIREALEELGLDVIPEKLVAVVTFFDSPQYYYQVTAKGGLFGTGKGPEMIGLYPEENGTYCAIWKAIHELRSIDVRPALLIPLIEAALHGVWPDEPLNLYETNHT
jgi:8-oxo-dGTP pyrophosphatase MutT (NUDIX family)